MGIDFLGGVGTYFSRVNANFFIYIYFFNILFGGCFCAFLVFFVCFSQREFFFGFFFPRGLFFLAGP